MRVPRSVFTIAKCCDANTKRYALGGVQLAMSPGGHPTAVATNGRVLAAVTWETDNANNIPPDGLIVDEPDCRAIAKLGKPTVKQQEAMPSFADVTISADNCQIVGIGCGPTAGQERHETAPVEGRFPKWRDVLPVYRKPVSIDVHPRELIRLLQALTLSAEVIDANGGSVRLTIETEAYKHPSLAACDRQPAEVAMTVSIGHEADQTHGIGVIMPMWDKNHPEYQAGTAQPKAWA